MNERYENARLLAINGSKKALIAHKNDDVFSIDEGLDKFDAEIPRHEIEPNSLLMPTLEFWSGWADSAEHSWFHYEPLGQSDWPRLAHIVLGNLKTNTEITDKEILENFETHYKPNKFFKKVVEIFR